jgi:hypothetical protein
MERIRESIDLCLEAKEDLPESPQFVGMQRILVET